jgi:hypothetical protein
VLHDRICPHIQNTTGAVSLECLTLPVHCSAQTFTWWLHVFVPQMNCFERKCFCHDKVKAKVYLWVQVQSLHYFYVGIEQDMKMCLLPLKRRPVSTRLHGATSQKMVIFKLATMRPWNLTERDMSIALIIM